MILVNFKTYQEATGEAALKLAKICQEVSLTSKIEIIPVVQATDLNLLSKAGIKVWVQGLNDVDFGPHTGKILPQAVIAAGAKGVILNHSENKIPPTIIISSVNRLRKINKNFKVLVCCESLTEAQNFISCAPDMIAYEPPELIGGDISVSRAKPEIITDFVSYLKTIPVLVGAGIHNSQDVIKALSLGAKGILVSSGVVLNPNPKEILQDLVSAFKK